ncbi:ABC transporter permease [Spirosoma sp.]|uniref:ABC transporter permease n=1 Tax=Spirosoma sp. TaxID=1899569 RepID=UPI00260243CC|nr:ABC transporter permease [Spirosoma sp.]MCX6215313.1 ABC transporter permease [Spirosoma sp.]
MLQNYLKIALRTLTRNRSYTLLNIIGLSVGIAASLLLFMVVRYEQSFDQFHPEAERVYRVVRKQVLRDGTQTEGSGSPLPVEAALKTDIPQFTEIVPVFGTLDPQVTVLGTNAKALDAPVKYIERYEGLLVGPAFFRMFHFPWLIGQPQALAAPNVVALSERFARKYFNDPKQAVGKFLRINNIVNMRVVGVLADAPPNTSFPMNLVISYATKKADKAQAFGFGAFDDWGNSSSNDHIFVKLPANFSVGSANRLQETFSRKHYDGRGDNDKKTHFLSPLADLHHDERFDTFSSNVPTVSRQRLRNLTTVGAVLLLMACINFVNIASALAGKRAKEVGVRKVLGSLQRQVVGQFLTETFLLVAVSLGLGVALTYTTLPLLTDLFHVPTDESLYFRPDLVPVLGGLLVLLTLLAGLYPAVVLSSFSPLDVFRRQTGRGWLRGITLRKSLIVGQFTAALVLIVSTVINLQQMDYLDQMKLGFAKDGVFTFVIDPTYRTRYATLRQELLGVPGVQAVAFMSDLPSSANKWQSNFAFTNLSKDEDFTVSMKMVDGDYFKTFGIQVLVGMPYAVTDTTTRFVVNETLLKKLGIKNPASVIGRNLRAFGLGPSPIVAVVNDFHTNSAKEGGIQPLVMVAKDQFYYGGSVKLQTKNVGQTVDKVKAVYARVMPEAAFYGRFYEDSLNNYYKAEQQMGLLYRLFAGLTVFIACLGLFGLATFTAQQRTKEIGIRKVLGASVSGVVAMLSKDFLKLVLNAIMVASPVAWYVMNRWLQDFAYRIQIEWWVFALAGLLASGITLLTVSFQSVKAALMNPVKSLRSD